MTYMRTEPFYTGKYIEEQDFSLSENGGIEKGRKLINPVMMLDWHWSINMNSTFVCVCAPTLSSERAWEQ